MNCESRPYENPGFRSYPAFLFRKSCKVIVMAHDDQVAHFFGGRNDTQAPASPPARQSGADEFGFGTENGAEAGLDGEISIDVYETERGIVIVSPVAGVHPEQIEITAGENTVTISGKRHAEHTQRKQGLIAQEIYWGSFSRTVQLPAGTDPEQAKASFKHGILTVNIPKTEQSKKKTIKVHSDE